MMDAGSIPKTILLSSLFKRLECIEPLTRIILSGAELSAVLTFRGKPEQKVLLDYSKYPARIVINDGVKDGHVYLTISGETMHEVLTGEMTPGTAIAQRELLLRGSPGHLAHFIPLLDFGNMLYREHLADAGCDGYSRASGATPIREAVMSGKIFNGDPIPLKELSAFEKSVFRIINAAAYALGRVMGFMRYRMMENMSLFDILSSMSRGLESAAAKKPGSGQKTK